MTRAHRATRRRAGRRPPPSGLRGARGRVRRIVTIAAPDAAVLRTRARPVPAVDAAVRKLVADMVATMRRSHGIGLAAPQIGVPLRVLVAGPRRSPVVLVNPHLERRWGSQSGPEGCLSIPGIYADVRRAQHVVVSGLSPRGRSIRVKARGLLSRVLQHEIDHLNGVLFIDRVAPKLLVRRLASPRAAPRRPAAGASVNGRRAVEVKTALRYRRELHPS